MQWVNGTVRSIDLQAQTLRTDSETLHWDRLVLATGSHAGVPPHCTSPDAVFNLNATRASALSDRLHQVAPGARVVVVGGGLTGIETASELAERYPHLSVSLVTGGELAIDFRLRARAYIRQTRLPWVCGCTSRQRSSRCTRSGLPCNDHRIDPRKKGCIGRKQTSAARI